MLSNNQIQKIDFYLKENEVEYFDLRQELTDHVSEAIEKEIEQNPELSFDEAFNKQQKRFTKKYLIEYNFIPGMDSYNPLKEWQCYTGKRILVFAVIFLFLFRLLYI